MRLRGKTALITGGSRGIGKAIAIGMAREGANITVNFVQRYEEAQNVVKEIERMGGRAIVCAADITDLSSVERMINGTIKEFEIK